MEVRKLERSENNMTRSLYEEIFPEDDSTFVAYYYSEKTKENQIYVIEDERKTTVSMLHLNPYRIMLGSKEADSQYIIAVATKPEYRHQGMMRRLIKRALADMYARKEPFVFLLPAAEAIYKPFDFRFIYEQEQCLIRTKAYQEITELSCRAARTSDLAKLSRWANRTIAEHYRTYALHTEAYFAQLLAEQRSQQGQVTVIMKEERICGYFFTAADENMQVREVMVEEQYTEVLPQIIASYLKQYSQVKVYGGMIDKESAEYAAKPMIMARVVCAGALVSHLTAAEPVSFAVTIEDELIPENAGRYLLKIDQSGGQLVPLEKEETWQLTAAQLIQLVFGVISPGEAAAAPDIQRDWQKVQNLTPVILNEIV